MAEHSDGHDGAERRAESSRQKEATLILKKNQKRPPPLYDLLVITVYAEVETQESAKIQDRKWVLEFIGVLVTKPNQTIAVENTSLLVREILDRVL